VERETKKIHLGIKTSNLFVLGGAPNPTQQAGAALVKRARSHYTNHQSAVPELLQEISNASSKNAGCPHVQEQGPWPHSYPAFLISIQRRNRSCARRTWWKRTGPRSLTERKEIRSTTERNHRVPARTWIRRTEFKFACCTIRCENTCCFARLQLSARTREPCSHSKLIRRQ